jgi:hypothetical protein
LLDFWQALASLARRLILAEEEGYALQVHYFWGEAAWVSS